MAVVEGGQRYVQDQLKIMVSVLVNGYQYTELGALTAVMATSTGLLHEMAGQQNQNQNQPLTLVHDGSEEEATTQTNSFLGKRKHTKSAPTPETTIVK